MILVIFIILAILCIICLISCKNIENFLWLVPTPFESDRDFDYLESERTRVPVGLQQPIEN